MYDLKKGETLNVFCCMLVFLLSFAVIIFDRESFELELLVGISVTLIIGMGLLLYVTKKDIPIKTKARMMSLLHGVFMTVTCFTTKQDVLFIMLMMMSHIVMMFFFEKSVYGFHLVVTEGLLFAIHFGNIPYMTDIFSTLSFWLAALIILVEDLIMLNIVNMVNNRDAEIAEQDRSVDDLLKVVEAKVVETRNATKSKSDFLASMSHEIRTPINAVLGFNEMIIRESSEEQIKDYANNIKASGNTLLGIINDILDFSKIESGKMEIHDVDYDLSSIINDLANMISIKASEKHLSFQLDIDHTVPHLLYGDEVRIKQIMLNLLTNAVKYTENGYVKLGISHIKLSDEEISLRIAVSDSGQGLKMENIDKLLSPFERIDETKNRHIEGTGLGMAITKQFLDMMGGELKIDSEYGKGSVFSFEIKQKVRDWQEIGDYEEKFSKANKSNDSYKEQFTAPEAKVLVVDDMTINIKVFENLLKNTQIQIDSAKSGMEALELVRNCQYDIIFLDHMMPEMDGIETLDKMKRDRFNLSRQCPVIALTANAVLGAREEYINAGFTDYLTKPISPAKLESAVAYYLPDEKINYTSHFQKNAL